MSEERQARVSNLCRAFFDLYSFSDVKVDKKRWNDAKSILFEIASELVNNARENGHSEIRESHSVGVGVPAKVPWIALMDRRVTSSARSGYYCTLLFDPFVRKIYLTLMVGVTDSAISQAGTITRDGSIRVAAENLKKAAENHIGGNNVFKSGPIMESSWNTGLQKSYALGTSFYLEIDTRQSGFQSSLMSGFESLIQLYSRIVDSGYVIQRHEPPIVDGSSSRKKISGVTKKPDMDIRKFLADRKYYYETEIVENILLSMKIKRLIILTGNSGSGKTRLARLIAEYCTSSRASGEDRMDIDVRVGKSIEHQGWTLNREQVYPHFPELAKYNRTFDIEIEGVKGRGKFEVLPRLFYENNNDIGNRLSALRNENPESRTTLSILLPGNNSDRVRVVAIGANWTDSRQIFGYYNPIIAQYVRTPAISVILSSNKPEHEREPHFLILDEMNLSHVERYFSDFLSAMEIENGFVDLHTAEETCGIPRRIGIKKNLFVVGTVNVDETTYMFSPKVLDRANVVEMPIVAPEDYLFGQMSSAEFTGDVEFLSNPLDDRGYGDGGIEVAKENLSRVTGEGVGNLWDGITKELQTIQDALEGSSFELGIRTLNEIIGFMFVSWHYEGCPGDFKNWTRYFDAQILQKVLPKIHGSNREISDLLRDLYRICLKPDAQNQVDTYLVSDSTEIVAVSRFPNSAKKISSMNNVLRDAKYVSFTR